MKQPVKIRRRVLEEAIYFDGKNGNLVMEWAAFKQASLTFRHQTLSVSKLGEIRLLGVLVATGSWVVFDGRAFQILSTIGFIEKYQPIDGDVTL